MKITKKLIFLVLAFFLLISPICLASDETVVTSDNGENVTRPQAISIINTDIYVEDQDVVIENVVNGNVFAFGSNVTVKGEIVGDLFVMANTLTIEESAVIYNNVFALANTFVMKGNAYDIYALSNNFELASSGCINRDVRLYVGNVNLSGLIKKDAYIIADSISMPEDAQSLIGGNLNYTTTQESTIPEGAVMGEVEFTQITAEQPTIAQIISTYIISFVNVLIYALVVVLLASFYTPKFIDKTTYCLEKRPFATAGIGILAFVLIPIVSIFFLLSGFLTYVGMALLAVYVLMLSITISILGMAVGNYLVNKLKNKTRGKFILLSLASVIVIWLLQLIPVVGSWISIFTVVFGFGLLLFAFFMRKNVSEVKNNSK